MVPMGIGVPELSPAIGVTIAEASMLLKGKLAVTPHIDSALAAFLGTSPGFWSGLQVDYEKFNGLNRTPIEQ